MVLPWRVYEYVEDKRYVGELPEPTAIGRSSLDGQPPHTTLYLRVLDGRVREPRFRTLGCGFLIAACGALIELALERSPQECLAISEHQIVEHLGSCPARAAIAPAWQSPHCTTRWPLGSARK